MPSDNDGKKESTKGELQAKVVNITDRLPVRFVGDDSVIRLASKFTMVIINNPASAVDYLVALGVVGKTVRDLMRASGLTEAEVDTLSTEAVHRMLRYSIVVGNKKDGDDSA